MVNLARLASGGPTAHSGRRLFRARPASTRERPRTGGLTGRARVLDTDLGLAPFLSRPYTTMHLIRPRAIRHHAGYSAAEGPNAFDRRNRAARRTGLSVAVDLATHHG